MPADNAAMTLNNLKVTRDLLLPSTDHSLSFRTKIPGIIKNSFNMHLIRLMAQMRLGSAIYEYLWVPPTFPYPVRHYRRRKAGMKSQTPPVYSLDDTAGDTSFLSFNINRSPSYLFSVLKDIKAVNPYIKIHLVPWSPVSILNLVIHGFTETFSASVDERL